MVNHHVSKLQASVGLLSGTVQDLTPRGLQEVASGASKPREFVDKYRAAAAQGTQNLAPMAEVLQGICADQVTREHFSSGGKNKTGSAAAPSTTASGGVKDFQALKEKLLQQVNKTMGVVEASPVISSLSPNPLFRLVPVPF